MLCYISSLREKYIVGWYANRAVYPPYHIMAPNVFWPCYHDHTAGHGSAKDAPSLEVDGQIYRKAKPQSSSWNYLDRET